MINLNKMQYYDFPYIDLIDSCKTIFINSQYIRYLEDWKYMFNKCNSLIDYELRQFISICETLNDKYEYYPFEQLFSNLSANYIYHFNIREILKKVNFNLYKVVPIKEFGSNIQYSEMNVPNSFNNKPILMVPFILPDYNYLVIDGNRRLNFNIYNNLPYIKSIIYNPFNKSDFIFSIDWCMYWFSQEINSLDAMNLICQINNSILYKKFNDL